MKKPKIAIWDIETGHNAVLTFRLLNRNMIPPQNILTEKYMISSAWQWDGQKKVHSVHQAHFPGDFKKDPHDDYQVVLHTYDMLKEADAIVHHYGNRFDWKFFHMRAMYHGLPPIKEPIKIDTYTIAKQIALYNSNRLDYISQYHGGPKKGHPGQDCWIKCYLGDADAVREMDKYCKQDIRVLSHVFNVFRPHVRSKYNYRLYTNRPVCRQCGSESINWEGWRETPETRQHRFSCGDCGAWDHISIAKGKKIFGWEA